MAIYETLYQPSDSHLRASSGPSWWHVLPVLHWGEWKTITFLLKTIICQGGGLIPAENHYLPDRAENHYFPSGKPGREFRLKDKVATSFKK